MAKSSFVGPRMKGGRRYSTNCPKGTKRSLTSAECVKKAAAKKRRKAAAKRRKSASGKKRR